MIINTKKIISDYGQDIEIIYNSNSLQTRAVIQALRSDLQSNLYGDYQDLDNITEQYLYIGISESDLSNKIKNFDNIIIKTSTDSYVIKKIEPVYLSNEIVYERGVLEKI